jgi:hypothetical protein
MSALRLELVRRTDGTVVFRCTRRDGSSTWQVHQRAKAEFFPAHDLTHFAVETTLGYDSAFYGLVARGWELTDFGAPWPRGPMPPQALAAELLVGFLDRERADVAGGGAPWAVADFDAFTAAYFADHAPASAPLELDADALDRVRAARDALLERWRAVAPGGTLALDFVR